METRELPLFAWQPPACLVIAFPSRLRTGHARKVARQMARARTGREAQYALRRAMTSHEDHLRRAGLPADEIERQMLDFRALIHRECRLARAHWLPTLHGNGGDAA